MFARRSCLPSFRAHARVLSLYRTINGDITRQYGGVPTWGEGDDDEDYDVKVKRLRSALPDRATLIGYQLTSLEFEKDDDSNFHLDFITAASNLRARNYRINESAKHETKGIAGKIIPAIATTTALVTELIFLSLTSYSSLRR